LDSCIITTFTKKPLQKLPGVTPEPFVLGDKKIQCACKGKDNCNSQLIREHHFPMEAQASAGSKCCKLVAPGNQRDAFTCAVEMDHCKSCLALHDMKENKYAQYCVQDSKAASVDKPKAEASEKAATKLFGDEAGNKCVLLGSKFTLKETKTLFQEDAALTEPNQLFVLCKCEGEFCNKHVAQTKSNINWLERAATTSIPSIAPTTEKRTITKDPEKPVPSPTQSPRPSPTQSPSPTSSNSAYKCHLSMTLFFLAFIPCKILVLK